MHLFLKISLLFFALLHRKNFNDLCNITSNEENCLIHIIILRYTLKLYTYACTNRSYTGIRNYVRFILMYTIQYILIYTYIRIYSNIISFRSIKWSNLRALTMVPI